jgi:hypothetical protein
MISFSQYFIIKEAFDTVTDFMLNPEHSDKDYDELVAEFEASGGEVIGSGSFGIVYSHPKWPYVLKVFSWDDPYLKFARYAHDNPHPSFPKFFGKPQRVVPQFTRYKDEAKQYLARIERLNPTPVNVLGLIDNNLMLYFHLKENPKLIQDRTQFMKLSSKVKSLPKAVYNLLEGWYLLRRDLPDLNPDLHGDNVMMRDDGQYVWVDPVWTGDENSDNPLTAAMTSKDYEPSNMLRGGRTKLTSR